MISLLQRLWCAFFGHHYTPVHPHYGSSRDSGVRRCTCCGLEDRSNG